MTSRSQEDGRSFKHDEKQWDIRNVKVHCIPAGERISLFVPSAGGQLRLLCECTFVGNTDLSDASTFVQQYDKHKVTWTKFLDMQKGWKRQTKVVNAIMLMDFVFAHETKLLYNARREVPRSKHHCAMAL